MSAWFVGAIDVDQILHWLERFRPSRTKIELQSKPDDVTIGATSPTINTRQVHLQVSKSLLQQLGKLSS